MDYNTKALDNYQFLLSLPIIVELIQKNKKLRKDNKSLKNLIYSIPEFRCKCSNSNTITEPKSNKIAPLRKTVQKSTKTDEKNIKLNVVKTEIIDVSDDDSVVFVEKVKKEITPNIIYVLEEELEEGEIREEEEEEVVEEEAEEEEEVVEEESEEEVFEIEIKGKSYYTTNETNGTIYNIDENEEIGEEIGKFENGKPVFYKK